MLFRLTSLLLVAALAGVAALHVHSARYWSGETFAQLRVASAGEGLLVLVEGQDLRVAPVDVRRGGAGVTARARLALTPAQSPFRVGLTAGDSTVARGATVRASVALTAPDGARWTAPVTVTAGGGERIVRGFSVEAAGEHEVELAVEGGEVPPGTTLELRRNTTGVNPWFVGGCAAFALAIVGLNVVESRKTTPAEAHEAAVV